MADLVQSDYWMDYVLASLFVPRWATVGLYVNLFSNNITPVHNTPLSSFTACTYPGYARQAMTTWGTPAFNGTFWTMSAPILTFTDTGAGPDNVYGYFITDFGGSQWFWAQLAPSPPIVLGTTQPSLGIIPNFAYQDIP
jgi:hypothetical protein